MPHPIILATKRQIGRVASNIISIARGKPPLQDFEVDNMQYKRRQEIAADKLGLAM
jgi:hypothetical protein